MSETSATIGSAGRWLILVTVGLAQLMVVLDATVVNIALPSAQLALGFTAVDRQWVVTAYVLAFGSLLLFGGRLGDLIGRKVTFLAGAFGALLAPAALSILSTTFSDPRERGKAFSVYGAIVGAGGAIGLVLGGIVTAADAVICGTLFRTGPLRAPGPAAAAPAGAAAQQATTTHAA
jgi:MFS family permease